MKTYIVTGASSGIGAATKRGLIAEGCQVINIDLHNADICADLSTPEGRQAAIQAVFAMAPDGIDGLVCCAGVSGGCKKPTLMAALNYYGAVAIAEGLFPLLEKKKGYCVLIASNSIAQGYTIMDIAKLLPMENSEPQVLAITDSFDAEDVGLGSAVYITMKYGISLWVRRHAASWGARGVHLNCVAPGNTMTPMVGNLDEESMAALSALQIPIKYGQSFMLEPEEVADVIIFLLSEKARAIHGTMIFADGGTEPAINTEHVY